MTSNESRGRWRRLWYAFGRALNRGIMGKSSYYHMKQFTAGDGYWDRPEQSSNPTLIDCAQTVSTRHPSLAITYEPVFGWTERQLNDYLAWNPDYRPVYEAELKRRRSASA